MNKLRGVLLFASPFCLKTKLMMILVASGYPLNSECCLIQATVLLKLVGVAPCSGDILKYFTEVVGTLVPALQIQGTEGRVSTKPSSEGKRI